MCLLTAVRCHRSEGLRDTDKLFGVSAGRLDEVSVEDWLLLLMRVYLNKLQRFRILDH